MLSATPVGKSVAAQNGANDTKVIGTHTLIPELLRAGQPRFPTAAERVLMLDDDVGAEALYLIGAEPEQQDALWGLEVVGGGCGPAEVTAVALGLLARVQGGVVLGGFCRSCTIEWGCWG